MLLNTFETSLTPQLLIIILLPATLSALDCGVTFTHSTLSLSSARLD